MVPVSGAQLTYRVRPAARLKPVIDVKDLIEQPEKLSLIHI